MLERVVVRDCYDQVIYEDVIDVKSEEDLQDIYDTALRFEAQVYRYSATSSADFLSC